MLGNTATLQGCLPALSMAVTGATIDAPLGTHLSANPQTLLGGQSAQPHIAGEEVDVGQDVAEAGVTARPKVNQVHLLA